MCVKEEREREREKEREVQKKQAGNWGVVSASTKHDLINDRVHRISIYFFFFVFPFISSSVRNPSYFAAVPTLGNAGQQLTLKVHCLLFFLAIAMVVISFCF